MFYIVFIMKKEEKRIERDLMSLDEFKEYLNSTRPLRTYIGVSKYKSVWRAMRRGHLTVDGYIIPKRPFSNGGNRSSRKGVHSKEMNEFKKSIYVHIKRLENRKREEEMG